MYFLTIKKIDTIQRVLNFRDKVGVITIYSHLPACLAPVPQLNVPLHLQKKYWAPVPPDATSRWSLGAAHRCSGNNLKPQPQASKLWLNTRLGCHTDSADKFITNQTTAALPYQRTNRLENRFLKTLSVSPQ